MYILCLQHISFKKQFLVEIDDLHRNSIKFATVKQIHMPKLLHIYLNAF